MEVKCVEEFHNLVKEHELLIVYFYTKSYNECSKIAPIFEEFSKNYIDIKFVKVDADYLEDLSEILNVEALPTFIIFESGKMTNKRLVSKNVNSLLELIKSVTKIKHEDEQQQQTGSGDGYHKFVKRKRTTTTNELIELIQSSHSDAESTNSSSTSNSTSDSKNNEINYIVGKTIGHGGFGKVNICTDPKNGEIYAVKHVNFEKKTMSDTLKKSIKQFQSEIDIIKNLNHERIVKYYGSKICTGGILIFLEYMPGGSLKNKISENGPMNEKTVKKYTKQILEGLDYLHTNRFIHRDVKSSNILCTSNDNIKLADFGNTVDIKEILNQNIKNNKISYEDCTCLHNTFTGTPHFMSPEILIGKKYGRGVDIWALGCTIIEMFTGKPPWYDLNFFVLISKMGSKQLPEYVLPDDVSLDARDFLKLAMCFEYEKRATANELLYHNFALYGGADDEEF